MKSNYVFPILFLFGFGIYLNGCKEKRKPIGQTEIVAKPEELKLTVSELIASTLEEAEESGGRVANLTLANWEILKTIYSEKDNTPLWTMNGKWLPKGDSLYQLIKKVRTFGLFPEDYFAARLDTLHRETTTDTSRQKRLDASLWAESDLLLTTALVRISKDLKLGRLVADSVVKRDSLLPEKFYQQQLDSFYHVSSQDFTERLEPRHRGYRQLKQALNQFLAHADLRHLSKINIADTLTYGKQLQQRLREDSILIVDPDDSLQIATGIKAWQKKKGLKANGKITTSLLARLNNTDEDKFIRVAITMDQYKLMPLTPINYVWVNIPAYRLDVIENDSTVLTSRVVVGKPITRTPQLTSAISDMITYPLWHIPNSIIVKDILPALKKDAGYLAKKGFSLVDEQHNEIDPYSVNWNKYSTGIPYTVVQGSGDANALGVLKFNFPNKYDVYLHDTNQREFFSLSERALSHGCVRVQAWDSLSYYLLRKDSGVPGAIPPDSLQTWLDRKEKHVIPLHKRVPLYIRYFTCEGVDGKLLMYEDIYGEDRRLRHLYFATK